MNHEKIMYCWRNEKIRNKKFLFEIRNEKQEQVPIIFKEQGTEKVPF